jgi:hypothetical protein
VENPPYQLSKGVACSTRPACSTWWPINPLCQMPILRSTPLPLPYLQTPSAPLPAPLHVPSTTTARGRDNCKSLELVRCGCRSWLLFRPLRNCLRPRKKNSTKATHETTNNNHSLKTSNHDYSSLDHPLSYDLGPFAIGLNSHLNYTSRLHTQSCTTCTTAPRTSRRDTKPTTPSN